MNPDHRVGERTALLLAGAATGALICAWAYRRRSLVGNSGLAHSEAKTPRTQHAAGLTVAADALQDDILREQFTRNIQFFGEAAQAKVFGSFVVIVGLGGVGSHAATMLLRSGVGKLRLIDFDQVSVSSLNRHAVATRKDVGLSKAECLKRHFRRIAPEAELDAINAMYSQDSSERLLSGSPHFVLDAIDNLETKASLIAACKRRNIPVLCVAGAGAKADPTRLRLGDLSDAGTDPLARTVRRSLRKHHGIVDGVPTLLSVEAPRCRLMPVEALPGSPQEFQIIPNFRVRTIPVLGPMPAMFGMAAASFILCHLAGKSFRPEPIFTMQAKQYTALLDRLRQREELVYGNTDKLELDVNDVAYLAREVWRGLSAKGSRFAAMGTDKGPNRPTDMLTLTRWDHKKTPALDNLVLLSFDEAEQHEDQSLVEVQKQDAEYFAYVTGVLASV